VNNSVIPARALADLLIRPDSRINQAGSIGTNQIEFVNLIVNHLTENGVIEAAMLYESPFTDLTPHGPEGLFSSSQVDELVRILNTVRTMASAA